MKDNLSIQYLDSLTSLVKSNFKKLKKDANAKHLHAFRVSVKKLNAFLMFSSFLTGEEETQNSIREYIRSIYTIGGKVRDLKLSYKSLKKFDKPSLMPLAISLDKKKVKGQKKLMRAIHKFRFSDLEELVAELRNQLRSASNDEIKKLCLAYFSIGLKKIHRLVDKSNDESTTHTLRIRVRVTMEILPLLHMVHTHLSTLELQILFEVLNKEIGKWHDLIQLKKVVDSHFENSKKSAAIKKTINKINAKIKSRKKKIDKALVKLTYMPEIHQLEIKISEELKAGRK